MAKPHALLFPYPLQGHINPLFALAGSLASSGILVTFVHSASNYSRIDPPDTQQSSVRLKAINPDSETLDDDPSFVHSMRKFEGGLEHIIRDLSMENHPVSCLISDCLMPWTHDLAEKFCIPRFEFFVYPALTYLVGYHLRKIIDMGYLPLKPGTEETIIDSIPGLPPLRVADIPIDILAHDASHLEVLLRIFSHVKEAAGLLINSSYDLEGSAIDALRAEQISVYPVGPLLPLVADGSTSSLLKEDVECLKWLDDQTDSSVIYVSFGSLDTCSIMEIQELALGLEASQQHFLWVIRPDAVSGALSDVLPDGFMSRTEKRGLIISWAPQLAVLSHRSVGGFLTHCGWNSVLESLWMGVPMIGCPRLSDQNTILKLIIDWKVGMAVQGKEKMGITRGSVETAIRTLMRGEEGQAAKERVVELREIASKTVAEGGHSKLSLQKLVEDLLRTSTRNPVAKGLIDL